MATSAARRYTGCVIAPGCSTAASAARSRTRSGRSNRKRSGVRRTAQYRTQRADDAGERHDRRDGADVVDPAVLEQQRAARRHAEEEGEVDDDRMLAAIAQRLEHAGSAPTAPRPRRRPQRRRARARARRTASPADPLNTRRPLSSAPDGQAGQGRFRLRAATVPPARRCAPRGCSRCRNRRSGAANSSITVQPVWMGAISSAAATSQMASGGMRSCARAW